MANHDFEVIPMNLVLTYNPSIVIKVHSVFGKNGQVRVRAKKLGCCSLRRTLRKCVRCACGCGRKYAHTKGLEELKTQKRHSEIN